MKKKLLYFIMILSVLLLPVFVNAEELSSDNNLSSITIDGLGFNFESDITNYNVTTYDSKATIRANLSSNKATFVTGYEPRSVDLDYGNNIISLKVRAEDGSIKVYTININRYDTRNNDARLAKLSVSNAKLSPQFNSNTSTYTAVVDSNVSSVVISASLMNLKSSFVSGYGPRTVSVNTGVNTYDIKIKSEKGEVGTYRIIITRPNVSNGGGSNTSNNNSNNQSNQNNESQALLKSLTLSDGNLSFDKNVFEYKVSVKNSVKKIDVNAEALQSDSTIVITGGEDLKVGDNVIVITVTSVVGEQKIYTIYVDRARTDEKLSSNGYLKLLYIEGYDIKFNKKTLNYTVRIKNENSLNITAETDNSKSDLKITGNANLKDGSKIKITVISPSGEKTIYTIKVVKTGVLVKKILLSISLLLVICAIVLIIVNRKKIFKSRGDKKPKIKLGKTISANMLSGK